MSFTLAKENFKTYIKNIVDQAAIELEKGMFHFSIDLNLYGTENAGKVILELVALEIKSRDTFPYVLVHLAGDFTQTRPSQIFLHFILS